MRTNMKKHYLPMWQYLIVDFFRSLQWNFRNLHLEVDMKLSSYGYIEITLPIAEDFTCVINIGDEIRLKFYKELLNGKKHYFKIPFEQGSEYLPSRLTDVVEMDEKGLFIYPHKPILDIIRTIRFVKDYGIELLPLLREAYETKYTPNNV